MATNPKTRKQTKPRTLIGADKAREQLGDLINRAGYGGEWFVLTRHGKQEVALISVDDLNALEASDAA